MLALFDCQQPVGSGQHVRIALIEDNQMLARGVRKALRDLGYAVDWLENGASGDDFLRQEGADLAIVDINLPQMSGLDVLQRLRARRDSTPVILLTARGDTADRVAGLDAGADDYLVKPFEMAELAARVRALTRRRPDLQPQREDIGRLCFERRGRRLFGADGEVALSRRELALFECLLDRSGQIVSKIAIADSLYGVGADIEPNAVESQVSRLRRKLAGGGVHIHTARGLGYMLAADENP